MLFRNKKFIAAVPIALVLAVVACLIRFGPVFPLSASGAVSYRTVVIDAGHGGVDGGATGRAGTVEKEINLAVALKTEQCMRLFGVPAVMTRTGDYSLDSGNAQPLRLIKAEDLHNRLLFTKAQDAPLFVSIHQNFFGDTVSRGAQTFYAADNAAGKAYAELLHRALQTGLAQVNNRKAAKIPNRNYLLDNLRCPAVIVECGFLSHPAEEADLNDAAYQSRIACALLVATLEMLAAEPAA